MIDPEKLTAFLVIARDSNRRAHNESENDGFKDPYWLGRLAMCNTILGWVEEGVFDGGGTNEQ